MNLFKYTFTLALALMLGSISMFAADNTIFADDITMTQGETATVVIKLNETKSLSALQFNVSIPTGFTVATGNSGLPALTIAEARAGSDHAVSGSLDGNTLKVMVYSPSAAVLPSATDGSLVSFDLTADASLEGDFNLSISDILASDAELNNVAIQSSTVKITVKSPVILASSIALDKTALNLIIGASGNLTATVLPAEAEQTVTWASSDENVATVDQNGNVTAVAEGQANITATTTDGTNLAATCAVTVSKPQATGITLNKEELALYIGESETLTATVSPELAEQAVTWASSDENVATVDQNGNVTAVAEGQANITATTTDGTNLTATCAVTVSKRAVPVSGISLAINVPQNQTLSISATITPADATNPQLKWSSEDENVATVDAEGNITGINLGTTTITVSATDGGDIAMALTINVVEGSEPTPGYNNADVNRDGFVNTGDVSAVYEVITNGETSTGNED